jgi:hypothetical protein
MGVKSVKHCQNLKVNSPMGPLNKHSRHFVSEYKCEITAYPFGDRRSMAKAAAAPTSMREPITNKAISALEILEECFTGTFCTVTPAHCWHGDE